MQIKEYLKEARTALNSGDVDAANNLTKKAKALLGVLGP
jgi:ribosomal protein S20